MILLKQLLVDCGISMREFGANTGHSNSAVCSALNRGIIPKRKDFVLNAETEVGRSAKMTGWLESRGLTIKGIWNEMPAEEFVARDVKPADYRRIISEAMRRSHNNAAMTPGDPNNIETTEGEMITPRALKHFKLFRSPFVNDVGDTKDIFFSEDHIFLKEMMLDTARHSGFTAVIGEVGSGKSVMRKAVVQGLASEDISVVFPVIVDKARITPASLIDAIILDVSEEKPKMRLEQKTRQALKLLKNRAASGMKQVLIIEEAHLLNLPAMKALKQIYELEDGFGKLIGIILVGQPELKLMLNETRVELREVTRRITCAEITGLNGDMARYVAHKFNRINRRVNEIFADDAFAAMEQRLKCKVGNRVVSQSYPLTVNNLAARAMNLAAEMGEALVTADVVLGV